ncbi:MAG TPA: NAD(P)(+) transhydrogenase (Re/Si-specific) subunit alpha, partial [Mycobacteriales bacterium]|nr:NAD(P)(+) transhydrogenase (Re/Si-specific) subunit alpha [Mycobacteriales bacterium]
MELTVGVVKETAPRERRVALDPDGVGRLRSAGCAVAVEAGAGEGAWFPDRAYTDAGATVAAGSTVVGDAAVLLMVRPPSAATIAALRDGQVVVGLLGLLGDPALAQTLAARNVTAVSLEGIPRLLSR